MAEQQEQRRFASEAFDKIVAALEAKGVKTPCSRCSATEWNLDATSLPVIMSPDGALHIPPPRLPVLLVVCRNCGFVAMHAPVYLGLNLKDLGLEP